MWKPKAVARRPDACQASAIQLQFHAARISYGGAGMDRWDRILGAWIDDPTASSALRLQTAEAGVILLLGSHVPLSS